MLSFVVYLLFFALLGAMLLGRKNQAFISVFVSLLVFPTCIYFIQKPQLSPQQLFLYLFFVVTFLWNKDALFEGIFKHPLRFPILLCMLSPMLTVILNGDGGKGIYNAFRLFMENYAYLIVAFIGGLAYKKGKFEELWFYPIIIFFVLGFIEFLIKTNWVFPFICKAFPYYDGFYDLNSAVSASRTYRSRIFITTTHPTVLGSILCSSLMMLTCRLKDLPWSKARKTVAWGALFLLICMSGSRTALVCALLGLGIYGFMKIGIRLRLFVIFLIVFGSLMYVPKVVDKFNVEGEGSSLSMREQQLLFSYMHFMKSPIYGNGVRYTSKYVMERDTYNDRIVDSEIGGLESIIFFQMIDYGIIGMACYALLFIMAFYYFFRRWKSPYAKAGLLVTVCFFIFACLSGEIGGNNTFAYMLMGYCMGVLHADEKESDETTDKESDDENADGEKLLAKDET